MGLLNREKLLAADKLQIERVDLSDDEYIFVKQLTGRERDQFEAMLLIEQEAADGSVTYERDTKDFRAKLAVCTACDEQGHLLLQPEDAALLSQNKSAASLEKIVAKAQELNGMSRKKQDKMVKNSDAGQSADSISDCAGTLDLPTPITCLNP